MFCLRRPAKLRDPRSETVSQIRRSDQANGNKATVMRLAREKDKCPSNDLGPWRALRGKGEDHAMPATQAATVTPTFPTHIDPPEHGRQPRIELLNEQLAGTADL